MGAQGGDERIGRRMSPVTRVMAPQGRISTFLVMSQVDVTRVIGFSEPDVARYFKEIIDCGVEMAEKGSDVGRPRITRARNKPAPQY